MPALSSPHIHLCTRDALATARYYEKMFGAKIIQSVQPDGQPRYDLDMSGLTVFILRIPPEKKMPESPAEPYIGLDHFGFMVKNLDEAVAELKQKGAKFAVERRPLHANELRRAGNIASESVDLRQQILALENLTRVAQGQ